MHVRVPVCVFILWVGGGGCGSVGTVLARIHKTLGLIPGLYSSTCEVEAGGIGVQGHLSLTTYYGV